MDGKGKISEYRSKLDKTLASPDLTNNETVHTLVNNQLLQSLDSQLGEHRDYLVKKRSKEVSNFLRELRSVSESDVRSKPGDESQIGWKLKQDTDELRVMYREGPEGTPFHTLLCEGFVDAPLDVCLCISCESDLYNKWWPQSTIPTFKVISSHRVKRIRMGEQISLVRMKLSWPMSSREALVHYFAFEYLQDGLVVVLLRSVSDSENIDVSTHGFSRDGIPDAQDVVRIDVFGGFAIQKVSEDRSYFRTIANMDIKLDIAPPSLINFIARQLVGSGFKLYKKEVSVASKGDIRFREALKHPLYTRIHEALYGSMANPSLDEMSNTFVLLEEQNNAAASKDTSANETNECDDSDIDSEVKDVGAKEEKEIEERDSDERKSLDEQGTERSPDNLTSEITEEEVRIDKMEVEVKQGDDVTERFGYDVETKVTISRQVREALGTLEKAISMIREYNNKNSPRIIRDEVKTEEHLQKFGSAHLTSDAPRNSSSSHRGLNSYTKEMKIAPDEGLLSPPAIIKHIDLQSSVIQINASAVPEPLSRTADANGNKSKATKRKNTVSRFCCLS
ncbi:hypothetical protein ACS0TY_015734 [Phlomoides rotata]